MTINNLADCVLIAKKTIRANLIFSFSFKICKILEHKTLEKNSWKKLDWPQQPWISQSEIYIDTGLHNIGFKQKSSQGAEPKNLNPPTPCDAVILVVFLPGEDLINAQKQTRSARWRGCCGVRTVAHRTHPPVGRKRSCVCVFGGRGGGGVGVQTGAMDGSL